MLPRISDIFITEPDYKRKHGELDKRPSPGDVNQWFPADGGAGIMKDNG